MLSRPVVLNSSVHDKFNSNQQSQQNKKGKKVYSKKKTEVEVFFFTIFAITCHSVTLIIVQFIALFYYLNVKTSRTFSISHQSVIFIYRYHLCLCNTEFSKVK